jgi:hypothetical protein
MHVQQQGPPTNSSDFKAILQAMNQILESNLSEADIKSLRLEPDCDVDAAIKRSREIGQKLAAEAWEARGTWLHQQCRLEIMNLEMNRNTPQTAQMQDCQEEEVDRAMDQYFLDDLSRILSEPGGPESESASNDGQSELDVASDSESGTETVDSAICMSRRR